MYGYRVVFAASGQVCAAGTGFLGVPEHVDMSRCGFGRFVLEAWPGGGSPAPDTIVTAAVDKQVLSFEEEKAKVPKVQRSRVAHVDGWQSSAISSPAPSKVWTEREMLDAVKAGSWLVALEGLVYDVSQFKDAHPGGVRSLMQLNGRDCTESYMLVHDHVDHQSILGGHCLGSAQRG
eukprot:SRR837773.1286.p1 GENE.SRR837773.1286~~SRR837773.1286.p1  ORF type:complete len:177 (-),score=35.10 SRR837773.1286:29-559(-)